MASLQNKTGRYIKPTLESFQIAAAEATFDPKKNFYLKIADPSDKESYPIITTSFALIPSKKFIINKDITKFYDWCYINGQTIAENLGFVPLPQELTTEIKAYWDTKGI